jgi:hypothetical protein
MSNQKTKSPKSRGSYATGGAQLTQAQWDAIFKRADNTDNDQKQGNK